MILCHFYDIIELRRIIMRNRIDKSEAVYDFIKKYVSDNGYAPTVREICEACNIKSTATAFNYLNELSARGIIRKTDRRNRAVSLKNSSITVPLIGSVAAGQPIFANENYEGFYSVPDNFFSGDDLFMLTVKGDSMINIGMFDKDKIIVQRQQTADNGDIIVALVDDSATVKRFFKRDGKVILHPENDTMEDFIYDDVSILGKVIGLMRSI